MIYSKTETPKGLKELRVKLLESRPINSDTRTVLEFAIAELAAALTGQEEVECFFEYLEDDMTLTLRFPNR